MNHPQSTVQGFNDEQHNPFEHVKYRIKGAQCPQNFKKDKKNAMGYPIHHQLVAVNNWTC
jgi:hypothetical protein